MEKPAATHYPVHDLIHKRWSPRIFSQQPVEVEKLLRLFEAARWSPSGGNQQPWNFIVATRSDPQGHARMLGVLNAHNQQWAQTAPVLILAIAKIERAPGLPNRFAWYDLGQATALLSMQATAEGLSLRQMGGFDAEKARSLFDIPTGYEAVTAIALGYRGAPQDLPEKIREREMEPRSRKPLSEFVFTGQWGHPLVKLEMCETPIA